MTDFKDWPPEAQERLLADVQRGCGKPIRAGEHGYGWPESNSFAAHYVAFCDDCKHHPGLTVALGSIGSGGRFLVDAVCGQVVHE